MDKQTEKKDTYFRSAEMSVCELYVKTDTLFNCLRELGELGLVQFIREEDGRPFHMRFMQEIAFCEEMNRIIRFIQKELKQMGVAIPDINDENIPPAPQQEDLTNMRTVLEGIEAELSEIKHSFTALQSMHRHILEKKAVLKQAEFFFRSVDMLAWSDSFTKQYLVDNTRARPSSTAGKQESLKLGYLAGTIPVETFFTFERVLWRVCYANVHIRHAEIRHTRAKSLKKKFVFMIFFHGEAIKKKALKICQGFHTKLFSCPESSTERLMALANIRNEIKDVEVVLLQMHDMRRQLLLAAAMDLPYWRVRVKKMTAIYHAMNQMDITEGDKHVIAECWLPTNDIPLVQRNLYRAAVNSGTTVPPIVTKLPTLNRTPPTYNKTNRVLRGFQALVDAYGVGNYKELNPAPFTMVSFPFLFAVMFGDFGHGILMTALGVWLVVREKTLMRWNMKNEIWDIIFAGRYIILAMGSFSMYTGIIYNDTLSKSLKHSSSGWKVDFNASTVETQHEITLDPKYHYRNYPYTFGLDPVWDASGEHAIITMNSFKMKLAIILGVVQMYFGMVLSAKNHLFFENYIELCGVCIPQMIFFGLFLYLVALIFLKWAWYSAKNEPPYNTSCAPSILILFIDMLLFKHDPKILPGCSEFMFKHQFIFQKCLVIVCVTCIPIMLLAKPLYILRLRRKKRAPPPRTSEDKDLTYIRTHNPTIVEIMGDYDDSTSSSYSAPPSEVKMGIDNDMPLGEIFINQTIHTIENVLGAVSHTASYLRLWALSLAHDQLSSVLWNMVLRAGLTSKSFTGAITLYVVFGIWAVLTVSILVVMEGLSAFLHTLRLHWVEFQSKFYEGAGTPFQPFAFRKIINVEEEED